MCFTLVLWSCFISGCFSSALEQQTSCPVISQHDEYVPTDALLRFMAGTAVTNVAFYAENILMALESVNDIIAVQCHKNDRISFFVSIPVSQTAAPINPFAPSVRGVNNFPENKVDFRHSKTTILDLVNAIAVEYRYFWKPSNGSLGFLDIRDERGTVNDGMEGLP